MIHPNYLSTGNSEATLCPLGLALFEGIFI